MSSDGRRVEQRGRPSTAPLLTEDRQRALTHERVHPPLNAVLYLAVLAIDIILVVGERGIVVDFEGSVSKIRILECCCIST